MLRKLSDDFYNKEFTNYWFCRKTPLNLLKIDRHVEKNGQKVEMIVDNLKCLFQKFII